MPLELRRLRSEDERHALAAQAELEADDFGFLPFYQAGEPWDAYLERIGGAGEGVGLPEGYVPFTDLYAVVDGVVAGRVSVRHRLTPSLSTWGGHIGYGVRPAFRRRGIATTMLRAALGIAHDLGIDPALVTCDVDNVGSAAVIERCGGVLANVVAIGGMPPKRRYWVPTSGSADRGQPGA